MRCPKSRLLFGRLHSNCPSILHPRIILRMLWEPTTLNWGLAFFFFFRRGSIDPSATSRTSRSGSCTTNRLSVNAGENNETLTCPLVVHQQQWYFYSISYISFCKIHLDLRIKPTTAPLEKVVSSSSIECCQISWGEKLLLLLVLHFQRIWRPPPSHVNNFYSDWRFGACR